ncbi:MAG TPA: tryptophan--tRNA ligase, partial [Thauera sp.]|nr:tryptophan--tRNA ligase [Thauera sp.]
GATLVVSEGFATPREAGALVTYLKQGGEFEVAGDGVFVSGERVAALVGGCAATGLRAALASFAE